MRIQSSLYHESERYSSEKRLAGRHVNLHVDKSIVAAGADGFAWEEFCTKELLRAVHNAADADGLLEQTITHL